MNQCVEWSDVVLRGHLFGSVLCCDWLTGTHALWSAAWRAIYHPPRSGRRWTMTIRLKSNFYVFLSFSVYISAVCLFHCPTHYLQFMHVFLCTCVFIYMSIHCQIVGVPPPSSHKPSLIMSGRGDFRWWVGKFKHAHSIYIHKRPSFHSWQGLSLCQSCDLSSFHAWRFICIGYRRKQRAKRWAGAYLWSSDELFSALQLIASFYTHTPSSSLPHPKRVSVMYGLPPLWSFQTYNSTIISLTDYTQ